MVLAPQDEEWLSPDVIESAVWQGPVQASVFVAVGIGLLVVVVGMDRLVEQTVVDPGWRVAHLLGVVAAVGWLLMCGIAVGLYSSVARATGDIGADLPAVQVGLHAGYVVSAGVLSTVATAFAGWLVGLALWARRAGVIGRPSAVMAVVAAVVCVVPQLLWSQPFGILASTPALLVIGAAVLRRAR